jgi:uncharacterized protein (TIGR00369 family)
MTDAPPWLDQLREMSPRMREASPYSRALGAELVEIEKNRALLRLPYQEAFVGDPETGVIAGGVVTALLDTACGYAVWAAMEQFTSTATLDLRIDYMRPARPHEVLLARAETYRMTRSIAFVRALAYETDPADPVAAAQGAFILNSDAGRKPGANLRTETAR